MNLILFEEAFETTLLEADDSRAIHIRDVLKPGPGDSVFVGFLNGLRARARVSFGSSGSVQLEITGTENGPPPLPIDLVVGLPRPHSARRILFEMASMGVARLHFFLAEKSQPSYRRSRLWTSEEWRQRLCLGAEQGFTARIPEVVHHSDIGSVIAEAASCSVRFALDNYEAGKPLGEVLPSSMERMVLAVGPEGGWSSGERDRFRSAGWALAHLGAHVLRTETACVSVVAALACCCGGWTGPTSTRLTAEQ